MFRLVGARTRENTQGFSIKHVKSLENAGHAEGLIDKSEFTGAHEVKKIIVIGCPGSGKSTLSRELHSKTGIPLYHLDMLHWNADRTTVEKCVFLERLSNVLEKDAWIIDGNYGATMELRMQKCDTIIFLDYPLDICLDGISKRRGKPRSDLPWVEPEQYDEEFIEFIKNYNSQRRPQVTQLLEKY